MTVAEALSNLVFAPISDLRDVKCSGNWMWPAKLPGEGAALYDACSAMCGLMKQLGIAIDGGKDSLSMAARVGPQTIKSPGTLVVSTYAPCPDVRKVVTPDLKTGIMGRNGVLLHVDLSRGRNRLGGSALAQCYRQLGRDCPDVESAELLSAAFNATQELIKKDLVLAGHDISDGGLITCVLEMAFAGMCGLNVNVSHKHGNVMDVLFAEELGWVLEVEEFNIKEVMQVFATNDIPVYKLGKPMGFGMCSTVTFIVNNRVVLQSDLIRLMRMWEETSYRLEFRQAISDCVRSEYESLSKRTGPKYRLTFNPDVDKYLTPNMYKVAILREEGTNGDREMAAAFMRVGFEVWDVTMQDLLTCAVTLDQFRGLVFPGGFSYADVLGSAKGWAAAILFNDTVVAQFQKFFNRTDTFSLGVCNGCQLMALIGWIGYTSIQSRDDRPDIVLEHNRSERFECRWSTVKIENSNSIMLRGMTESTFGVWVAHGEGRFVYKTPQVLNLLERDMCVALRYVDDTGLSTEEYPMNPNGSIRGVAGICSLNGRHLAMMPHPERCDQMFQWPWMPNEFTALKKSPWETMFRNSYEWCLDN